jgi:hypothetical protein
MRDDLTRSLPQHQRSHPLPGTAVPIAANLLDALEAWRPAISE